MKLDFHSDAWQVIARYVALLIETERLRNEDQTKDIAETNYIRGKIAAYKGLLALPKQPAALTSNVEPE
jgi:hypothetical protein